jgi:hypothetical protein
MRAGLAKTEHCGDEVLCLIVRGTIWVSRSIDCAVRVQTTAGQGYPDQDGAWVNGSFGAGCKEQSESRRRDIAHFDDMSNLSSRLILQEAYGPSRLD